ncbi:MAG: carboxypeptidase-like regulatory domain-containing protein, partial [Nitrososphaerales archaeon]
SQDFEFWIELYYQYSYRASGPISSFFSTYQEAALTDPVLISPLNEYAHPVLKTLVGMRSGAYELRTFFESGGNLSVEQTTILVQGASLHWIWLGGCTMSSLNGPTFITSSTLSNSSNDWPTTLFLSYKVDGLSFYILQPLDIQIGGFSLFINAFQQVPTNIGIEVNVSKGVYEVVGESVFLASLTPAIQINYSLSFGGKMFQSSAPTYYTTFAKQEVNLGRMSAIVTHDGKGYQNATVTLLNDALDGNVTLLSGPQGNATFFGPPGSYTLSVSVNGSTITKSVSLEAGQSNIEQISLDPSSGGLLLSPGELDIVILASVVASLGILANLWIWIFKSRRTLRK